MDVLNLLNESVEAKKTVLRSAGWFADPAYTFDDLSTDPVMLNTGFSERTAFAQNSAVTDFVSRVMLDFVLPARVLPVQTELALRFNRSPPNFCLMSKEGSYRIRIKEAKIYALKMSLTEQALFAMHRCFAMVE